MPIDSLILDPRGILSDSIGAEHALASPFRPDALVATCWGGCGAFYGRSFFPRTNSGSLAKFAAMEALLFVSLVPSQSKSGTLKPSWHLVTNSLSSRICKSFSD